MKNRLLILISQKKLCMNTFSRIQSDKHCPLTMPQQKKVKISKKTMSVHPRCLTGLLSKPFWSPGPCNRSTEYKNRYVLLTVPTEYKNRYVLLTVPTEYKNRYVLRTVNRDAPSHATPSPPPHSQRATVGCPVQVG